ncbi:MAG: xanthine dehydrogenase family protein subunit M [Deltaproteobacteria bacterium HGW-Deltaproteobacteria-21]|nr:MAG: xanthine dehydrogenase family protein subunit M [Deltaproteobacteria bacterium HGW-Deltaproteobacteria-21]
MLIGLPKFEYLSCETMEEASSMLLKHVGNSRILAGGTDLFVKMKHRRILPGHLISIKKIQDLHGIGWEQYGLRIGALTSIEEIRNSPLIATNFPILKDAAERLGTMHIRNLATLGGNIANASPAAEFATPLLTLGASVKLAGAQGERIVALEDFFVGPGKSVIQPDEILSEILIPSQPFAEEIYLKHSTRPMDVAIVNLAVLAEINGDRCDQIKIALGAVGPVPFRCRKAEELIRGSKFNGDLQTLFREAAQIAVEESRPIGDFRASAENRIEVIRRLVVKGLEQTVGKLNLRQAGVK